MQCRPHFLGYVEGQIGNFLQTEISRAACPWVILWVTLCLSPYTMRQRHVLGSLSLPHRMTNTHDYICFFACIIWEINETIPSMRTTDTFLGVAPWNSHIYKFNTHVQTPSWMPTTFPKYCVFQLNKFKFLCALLYLKIWSMVKCKWMDFFPKNYELFIFWQISKMFETFWPSSFF